MRNAPKTQKAVNIQPLFFVVAWDDNGCSGHKVVFIDEHTSSAHSPRIGQKSADWDSPIVSPMSFY